MKKNIHENSIESYYEGKQGLFSRRQAEIMHALKFAGDAGLTAREVKNRLNLEDLSQIRSRITELKEQGYVEVSDRVKCPTAKTTVSRFKTTNK